MSEYLRDLSKGDKVWDKHKRDAVALADLLAGDEEFAKAEKRLRETANTLTFGFVDNPETGESKLKLKHAWFSRYRHDPVSVWRKTMKWRWRWFEAIPKIFETHPTHEWIFLTLTVKNCDVKDLKANCKHLNASFRKLTRSKELVRYFDRNKKASDAAVAGYYKALEVTRNDKDNTAHPHLHVLLHLPASYFKGENYLTQKKWADLWQKSAGLDYLPVVDVRKVRPNAKRKSETASETLKDAVLEVTKYPMKIADLLENAEFTKEYIRQINRTRIIETAGTLRQFINEEDLESENEDLIHVTGETETDLKIAQLFFEFNHLKRIRKYEKTEPRRDFFSP